MGDNSDGQLGIEDSIYTQKPIKISKQCGNQMIQSIACGFNFSAILTIKNKLLMFGNNSCGQLGKAPNKDKIQPTPLDITDVILSGSDEDQPKPQPNFNESQQYIKAISCGFQHTIVLTNTSLYTFGSNQKGQLGIGNSAAKPKGSLYAIELPGVPASQLKYVQCGQNHSVVASDTQVFTFGQNNFGQLGNSEYADSQIPINISSRLKYEQVKQICCGFYYTSVLTHKHLYLFGENGYGQIGDGT